MPGRCVAGPFWAQAVNQKDYIYKSVSTNHFILGHAEVVERAGGCQPSKIVPRVVQPMSQVFVTTEGCNLMIPHMSWPTISVEISWLDSKWRMYVRMWVGVNKYVYTSGVGVLFQLCSTCTPVAGVPLLSRLCSTSGVGVPFRVGSLFCSTCVPLKSSSKIALSFQQSIL